MPAAFLPRGARAISVFRLSRSGRCSISPTKRIDPARRSVVDLAALRRELDSLIGQCRHRTIGECRIVEALAPGNVC
jgi:hypothetical protein